MPRYELVEGTSRKFWEVRVEEATLVTTYGRIGASRSSTTKPFPDGDRAKAAADKLVAEKLKKGYQLVGKKAAKKAAGKKKSEQVSARAQVSTIPMIRSDGLYRERARGSSSWLYFTPAGVVRELGMDDDVGQRLILSSLQRDGGPSARGRWTPTEQGLRFSLRYELGSVDYQGTIQGDKLTLSAHSHIDGARFKSVYRFVPMDVPTKAPEKKKKRAKAAAPRGKTPARKGSPGGPRWRSLAAGEVELAELEELLADFHAGAALLEDPGRHDVNVVDGDLALDHLSLPGSQGSLGLVVKGSLTLRDGFTDTDYPATSLFVLGDMTCAYVVTAGRLGVRGSLRAERGVIGDYNDYSAEIQGDLVTTVMWEGDHGIDVGGKRKVELDLDRLKPKDYPRRLLDGLYEGDEADDHQLNREEILDRIRDGRPVSKPSRGR
jgi:predicted DNA-binding WGR domain protein